MSCSRTPVLRVIIFASYFTYRLVKLATAPGVNVSRPPMVVDETEYMRAVRAVTCLPPERKPEKKRKTEGPAEEDEAAPKTQTNSMRARAWKVQPRRYTLGVRNSIGICCMSTPVNVRFIQDFFACTPWRFHNTAERTSQDRDHEWMR